MPHSAIVREIGGVVIDVSDLGREAIFWGELLGQERPRRHTRRSQPGLRAGSRYAPNRYREPGYGYPKAKGNRRCSGSGLLGVVGAGRSHETRRGDAVHRPAEPGSHSGHQGVRADEG